MYERALSVCVHIYVYTYIYLKNTEEDVGYSGIGVTDFVTHHVGAGLQPRSSVRAAGVLNHRAFSPAPGMYLLL